MAEVYKAYHPGLDRYVAVKVLHSFLAKEEDFLVRFQREARIVASFRHPHIVQVYDCDYDADSHAYYMVMELVDGPNLKSRLEELSKKDELLPLEEAIQIVAAIANALDCAHEHGLVHRDIKPANILFGQDDQVVLSDFGIARMINTTTLTASGAMVGTPAYMAPEQGIGQTGDERSDIYSLGAVLYELVTGYLPFDADTPLGVILKHINAPLTLPSELNPDVPPGVEAAIVRALAKDPNNRYQTAADFAADLDRGMSGECVERISPEVAMALSTPDTSTPPPAKYQTKPWEWPTLSGSSSTPTPIPQLTPGGHPIWGWIAVFLAMLAQTLIAVFVLLFAAKAPTRLAALFPQADTPTPTVAGTPTFTPIPDLTATYGANATQFAAWMATYEATTGVTPTPSPTLTPTPTATPTPDLTTTAIAACVFDMEVVTDRAVWPSVLIPGQQFVKRWTVKNTGTCTWLEGVQLVFSSGDELDVVREAELTSLSPGETAEVKITLRAPAAYRGYASVWRLQDGAGNLIGEELAVTCRVGATPTPRPTATPTVTPTPVVTITVPPTPSTVEPLRIDSVGIVHGSFRKLESGQWEVDVYVVARGGDGRYRFYRDVISAGTEFFAPDPDEPWVGVYYDAQWVVCENMWISFWVRSAGKETHWDGIVPYPYPGECK